MWNRINLSPGDFRTSFILRELPGFCFIYYKENKGSEKKIKEWKNMKFFKWAYDKIGSANVLLTEYIIKENISQAEGLSIIYHEMIEMGVY